MQGLCDQLTRGVHIPSIYIYSIYIYICSIYICIYITICEQCSGMQGL